jgi:hypothetical protein
MKKFLLLMLIAFGAWNYLDKQPAASFSETSVSKNETGLAETFPSTSPHQRFSCDGRVYCSDMTSRAEAEYFTSHCPGTKMDGDHDGVPCENDSRF